MLNTSRRNEKNVSSCNEMSIQVSLVFPYRELLNAHRDNLGTTIKFVIFNELSNARNPNNMQILYTVLQHSSEQAPKVGAVSWITDGNPRTPPDRYSCFEAQMNLFTDSCLICIILFCNYIIILARNKHKWAFSNSHILCDNAVS